MATYARKLKDSSGNYIAPATRASCVYMEDDTTLEDFVNNLDLRVDGIYPIGSVYQSFEETSPASLFGGEWEKLENTFLYGSGDKTLGTTGGEETHVLISGELPVTEGRFMMSNFITVRASNVPIVESASGICSLINSTYVSQDLPGNVPQVTHPRGVKIKFGADQAHNNMPPYTVINIWKRVA